MRFFLCLIFSVAMNSAIAQVDSDSIYVSKSFLGYKFYHQDSRVNFNALPALMSNHAEAYDQINKARKKQIVSSVLGGVGGFIVFFQLGATLAGFEENWAVVGAGAGLIVVSIPISTRAYRQALYAIDLYNEDLGKAARGPELKIGSSQNGIGLTVYF